MFAYTHHILVLEGDKMDTKSHAPKVLVVDDEIGPRESLKMILKPNYNVFTVDSGAAAIQMVQKMKLDVITLDLKMPGLSGIEILKEIRKIDQNVRVIIVTGWTTLRDMMDTLCHGVFGYITKPFNVPEVIRTVEESLEGKTSNLKMETFL
jgi:DNA-binding NtrC family response regulator